MDDKMLDDLTDALLEDNKQVVVADEKDDKEEVEDVEQKTTEETQKETNQEDKEKVDSGADEVDDQKQSNDDDKKQVDDDKKEVEDDKEHEVQDDDQAPKLLDKDGIKEALREIELEKVQSTNFRQSLRADIEGLMTAPETVLRDTDGKVINGVMDVAGRLKNPATGELFTYEEAVDALAVARKELDRSLENFHQDVDAIAETNQSIYEGSLRVMHKWGDTLAAMPDVAEAVKAKFEETFIRDPQTGLVVKAPVDIEGYYDLVLQPYYQMNLERNKQREMELAAEEQKKQKQNQAEREDIKGESSHQRGRQKDNLDEALDRYLSK